MKPILAIILILATASCVNALITIDTVPVGDVGNPNDPATGNLYGGVGTAYNIGKYEVTVGQYTAFLNTVAATDTYSLYNPKMATNPLIAGIAQSCTPNCMYSVIGSADHPVTYVSWGDAARFANWLNNGQPRGAEDTTTTEDGAYFLNGATSNTDLLAVTRKPGATWFIPTENEWYKAAYYQPAADGGDADGYWAYPMKTNSVPNSAIPPGASAPDPTRVGNFYADDSVSNGYDNGYAVTGATEIDNQNYLSDVGAYTSSPSYYGTFDQGGNVWDWNETSIDASRGTRGGSWYNDSDRLQASYRNNGSDPTFEYNNVGFRVASIQLPGDFNGDGSVDAADYVVWRKTNGSAADYELWRSNFGNSVADNGASLSETAAVPEPSATLLILSAIVLVIVRPPARYFWRANSVCQ